MGGRRWMLGVGVAIFAALVVGGALRWCGQGPPPPSRGAPPPPARPSKVPISEVGPAQIRVTSEPPGATIVIDGRSSGRFAPDLLELPAGRPRRLRLEYDGYEPWEELLELRPGEVRELDVRLTPMPP